MDLWLEAESAVAYQERASTYEARISEAVRQNLLNDSEPVIDIFDFDAFDARLEDLFQAFPENFITHALAVKSQPIAGILRHAINKYPERLGTEAASLQEAWHGKQLGVKNNNIVYDSPVKSKEELAIAIQNGFYINLDNQVEMSIVDELMKNREPDSLKPIIGLRINPLAGDGAIGALSTAGVGSKFGLVYCDETYPQILAYFRKYTWLEALHCHVGSQGCPLSMAAHGARTIYGAAERLNSDLAEKRITCLDIGGGVPTSYWTAKEAHSFSDYRKMLVDVVPDMFSGKYRLVTEFGRSLFAKYGITVTKVASLKGSSITSDNLFDKFRAKHELNPVVLVYVGSNSFLREAYQMHLGKWRRRFTAFDSTGKALEFDNTRKQDIAGPLCFQGDYLCKDVPLPSKLTVDDILVMHDTGGYTMALYSKYNSRPAHSVYAYNTDQDGKPRFRLIKKKETMEQVLGFWAEPKSEQ